MSKPLSVEEIFDKNVGEFHRKLAPQSYKDTVKAMEEYAVQKAIGFADFLISDYEMYDIKNEPRWRLCGTQQFYTTQEIFEEYEQYESTLTPKQPQTK